MEKKIIVIVALILTLSSCSLLGEEEPTPSPSPTQAPTPTATPIIAPTATPSPTPEPVEMVEYGYVTLSNSDSHLNMRDEPNSEGTVIESLPNGAKLEILDEDDLWYHVKYGGKTGYVSRSFVGNIESMEASPDTSTSTPDGSRTAWINVDALRIRSEPSTDSDKLGQIPYGTSVQGVAIGDWMHTTYNGMNGYIFTGEVSSGRSCVVYSSDDLVPLPSAT